MNSITNTPDTACCPQCEAVDNTVALMKWAEEVSAMHAELTKPINVISDPRLIELVAVRPNAARPNWEPQDLADFYFSLCVKLPDWPLSAPAWTVRTDVRVGTWPEVMITHKGRDWEKGNQTVRLEHFAVVVVEDMTYDDGTPAAVAGTLTDHGTAIGCGSDDLTETEAADLSDVLASVVAEARNAKDGI